MDVVTYMILKRLLTGPIAIPIFGDKTLGLLDDKALSVLDVKTVGQLDYGKIGERYSESKSAIPLFPLYGIFFPFLYRSSDEYGRY